MINIVVLCPLKRSYLLFCTFLVHKLQLLAAEFLYCFPTLHAAIVLFIPIQIENQLAKFKLHLLPFIFFYQPHTSVAVLPENQTLPISSKFQPLNDLIIQSMKNNTFVRGMKSKIIQNNLSMLWKYMHNM